MHYFYGPPTTKPAHHRFDKGSYVYLFENPSQGKARLEVANHAGTQDQDAFNGCRKPPAFCNASLTVADLDGVHIEYSYKRTTLVTLTVESPQGHRTTPLEIPEWHLPTFDPRNENKYMYKLHTVDLYFWAKEDALLFVNAARRMLPSQQVAILDEPITPPPHREPMSPVVQKLEDVAVSDPNYQNGQTKNSSSSAPSFPGPPTSAVLPTQEATNFTPMAYNPSAPAAPETFKHREKTPPPEDGAGNPLFAAAVADQHGYNQIPGPPGQPPSNSGYFPQSGIPGPPTNKPPTSTTQSPFAHHFQNQFAPPPTQPISTPQSQQAPTSSSPPNVQPGYQAQQQFTSFPLSSSTPSGVASPGSHSQTSTQQDNGNAYSQSTQAPPGGFAQFNYGSSATSSTQPLQNDHSIHSQVYRPTEIESNTKHHDKPGAPKPPSGKLEARANKLEKGVGGFLKKLEKKYG